MININQFLFFFIENKIKIFQKKMGKYKYNCDYCDKKFLNYKAFKRYHKLSLQHRNNVFRHYHQMKRIYLYFVDDTFIF